MTQATKGFAALTAQQIYNHYKTVTPDDARAIARVLNLGSEPFNLQTVEKILAFAQQAKACKLSIKQAISQVGQATEPGANSFEQRREPDSKPALTDSEIAQLPSHLQSLISQAGSLAQAELEQLDRIVYEQVELPAAQSAVDRVLAADGNIEQLMLKLLPEAIAQRPGRLGGLVLQAVGQFRPPTLQGIEQRYALPGAE
jgi:(2Fe-2S) ferredoxin